MRMTGKKEVKNTIWLLLMASQWVKLLTEKRYFTVEIHKLGLDKQFPLLFSKWKMQLFTVKSARLTIWQVQILQVEIAKFVLLYCTCHFPFFCGLATSFWVISRLNRLVLGQIKAKFRSIKVDFRSILVEFLSIFYTWFMNGPQQ